MEFVFLSAGYQDGPAAARHARVRHLPGTALAHRRLRHRGCARVLESYADLSTSVAIQSAPQQLHKRICRPLLLCLKTAKAGGELSSIIYLKYTVVIWRANNVIVTAGLAAMAGGESS